MTDIEKLIENVDEVQTAVRDASSMIFHSTPMTGYTSGPQLDLRDILIVGASTGRNALINGSTAIAKTHLALALLAGLYGPRGTGYAVLQIDPSLEAEKLFNLDAKKLQDGLLSDAIINTPLITAPGILLDEINRAPQVMLNVLQAYMNNQAVTPSGGVPRQTGIEVPGGFYQFKVGTCNEGKLYDEGTFKLDPAFRRRFPIEVPLDLFRPTDYDMEQRRKAKRTAGGLAVPETKGVLKTVIKIHNSLAGINFHPLAEEFIAYLSRMDNCIKSNYKTKRERGFSTERCNGCHARGLAGAQNICANVYSPSVPQEDIEAVARGFALLRAYYNAGETGKIPRQIEVSLYDVTEALPFVASTKFGADPAWLEKHFKSGEPFELARAVGINIEQRLKNKLRKMDDLIIKKREDYTADERAKIENYCKEDPWAFGLRDCDFKPAENYRRLRR